MAMVLQLRPRLAVVCIAALTSEAQSSLTRYPFQVPYKVDHCHSLLQTQSWRSKKNDTANPASQGSSRPEYVNETKGKSGGTAIQDWRTSGHAIVSTEFFVIRRKLNHVIDSINTAVSFKLHRGAMNSSEIFVMCMLIILSMCFVLCCSAVFFNSSRSVEEGNDSMSSAQFDSQRAMPPKDVIGRYLCPEMTPQPTADGTERVYALQNPGVQTPGEMVLMDANGATIARTRAGDVRGGALLLLVAPGGNVMATCSEHPTEDLRSSSSARSNRALVIKDRLGGVFAHIFDKGHIEAQIIHNDERLKVVRQEHTGAMSVVNHRSELVATVEAPRDRNKELSLLLRVVTGADLGIILMAMIAHSCFERRNPRPSWSAQVFAQPLLRMAPQKSRLSE